MGAYRDSLAADAFDGAKPPSAASGDVPPGLLVSFDSTLPPTPLSDLLAADGATVFVLSADHELIRTVTQASGGRYPIRHVGDWADLVAAAAAGRTHVVLLDADRLPVALPEAVATLHEVAPAAVVLVAASRDAAQPVMRLLSARRVHRLLIKPATDAMTRLLLESAIGRYLELREQHAPPAVLIDDVPPRRRSRRPRTAWPTWLLATAFVTAVVGAVAVSEIYGVRWRGAIDRMIAGRAEVADRADPQSVAPSRDGRPAGTEATAAQPAGGAERGSPPAVTFGGAVERPAIAAARPVEPIAVGTAASASSAAAPPSSADISAVPSRADPRRETAPPLEANTRPTDIGAYARAAADVDSDARPADVDADARAAADAEGSVASNPELDALLELIDARLADGRLITDGDSARAYFEQAMRLNPLDPRLVARRAALAAGLVDAARAAVGREELATAQRLAEEAFRLGAEPAALARLDREIESARRARTLVRQAEALSAARALLQQGRLLDADGEGALARLAALRRERSTLPGLADAWRELTEAVAANVDAAIAAGDFAAARSWASALAIDGGDPALAAELEFEARQAEFLATPIPASELTLIEAPALVYPNDALVAGEEGWVDVEFVVDRDGRPRNIAAIDGRRSRRFADAAIEAVAGHRYAPFVLDGRVYERRVRARVRFELQ